MLPALIPPLSTSQLTREEEGEELEEGKWLGRECKL